MGGLGFNLRRRAGGYVSEFGSGRAADAPWRVERVEFNALRPSGFGQAQGLDGLHPNKATEESG
jgi:hypothetical protein